MFVNRRGAVTGGTITQHFSCDNFYFLTNPEEFVYTHLASDAKWQLLARPVTIKEFEQMAKLIRPFFNFGMKVTEYLKCVLYANDGKTELALEIPDNCDLNFTYRFWISNKGQSDKADSFKGVKLKRYVFLQRAGKILTAKLSFPVQGKFRIDLYGNSLELCNYVIHCDKPKINLQPLPENALDEWGPTSRNELAGLAPITHPTGTVKMAKGESDIEFKAEDDVELLTTLYGSSGEKLENYVLHYRDGDKKAVRAKVPEKGQYALNINSKRKGERGSFNAVCTYLVEADTAPVDNSPFPDVYDGRVGPSTTSGGVLKLVYPTSYMTETKEAEMMFTFEVLSRVDLICRLQKCNQDGSTINQFDMVMESIEADTYICHVRFPEPGNYLLDVYSSSSSSPIDTTYSHITTCLVKATKDNDICPPFPYKYDSFKEGKLLKPLFGVLPSNEMILFALTAPKACDVVVNANEKLTHLIRNKSGIWEGDATTGAAGRIVKISGKTDTDDDSYMDYILFEVN